jgi:hypothetical protein
MLVRNSSLLLIRFIVYDVLMSEITLYVHILLWVDTDLPNDLSIKYIYS